MCKRLVSIAILLLIAASAYPCSTFCIAGKDGVVFGRNYDFEIGDGLVLVNQRGVHKTSYAASTSWTSVYGSVTFNQWGKEFPMDGMNEAGLVVALMWLEGSVYPPADSRPPLGVLEWIQYQLDRYGSVAEVLEHADDVRVRGSVPLHYLIADASGAAATIEYLDGSLVVHTGAALPTANLTNDTYERSSTYLREFAGFGGKRPIPTGVESLDRFVRTASLMKSGAQAFTILDSVAQPGWTRWSIVYDVSRREIAWKSETSQERKTIRFDTLDFSCASSMKMMDANAAVVSFVPYSAAANLALIEHSYASVSFTRGAPHTDVEADAAHGQACGCPAGRRGRAVRR